MQPYDGQVHAPIGFPYVPGLRHISEIAQWGFDDWRS